jgi:DNA-binding transcriptional ArsR family regulator
MKPFTDRSTNRDNVQPLEPHPRDDAEFETTSNAVRALAHPARLSILCLLSQREHSVVGLTRRINNHTQSSISQHLGFLLKNGIVSCQKLGTKNFYRIKDPKLWEVISLVVDIHCRTDDTRYQRADRSIPRQQAGEPIRLTH